MKLLKKILLVTSEELDAFKEGKQRYDVYKSKKNNKLKLAHTELSCKL